MVKNLIYVHRFTIDNYVSVEFDSLGFTVKDLSIGTPLQLCDNIHSDPYHVLPSVASCNSSTALVVVSHDIWHRRLSHPSASIFNFLHPCNFISCPNNYTTFCHACELGKHCRLPFSLSQTKTSRVFELIHYD